MSNFTFDARSQHTAENHGPTMFHMATVSHKRWDPCLLYCTSSIGNDFLRKDTMFIACNCYTLSTFDFYRSNVAHTLNKNVDSLFKMLHCKVLVQ